MGSRPAPPLGGAVGSPLLQPAAIASRAKSTGQSMQGGQPAPGRAPVPAPRTCQASSSAAVMQSGRLATLGDVADPLLPDPLNRREAAGRLQGDAAAVRGLSAAGLKDVGSYPAVPLGPPTNIRLDGCLVEWRPRRRWPTGDVLSKQTIERDENWRVVLDDVGSNRDPLGVVRVVLDHDVVARPDKGDVVTLLMEVNARPVVRAQREAKVVEEGELVEDELRPPAVTFEIGTLDPSLDVVFDPSCHGRILDA